MIKKLIAKLGNSKNKKWGVTKLPGGTFFASDGATAAFGEGFADGEYETWFDMSIAVQQLLDSKGAVKAEITVDRKRLKEVLTAMDEDKGDMDVMKIEIVDFGNKPALVISNRAGMCIVMKMKANLNFNSPVQFYQPKWVVGKMKGA